MKKVVFMGTPDFSVPILEALVDSEYEVVLVVTQPDRPKGRRRTLTAPPVKEAALRHEIPVFQPEKLSDNYEEIIKYDADIIITAAYGQLLPNELLESPPFGSINVHASLLPELRGGAPIHYAILQGKKETGITIMYMVEKLDAGDIISQKALAILPDDDVGMLHDKLSVLGVELLLDTLPSIFARTSERKVQDEACATFASNITREQERIDWDQPSETVYNQIRGLHPWPVAYTICDGKRMKVWQAERVEKTFENSSPGEVVACDTDGFIVVCNDNKAVKITGIQPAGSRRLTVADYFKGNPGEIVPGQIME